MFYEWVPSFGKAEVEWICGSACSGVEEDSVSSRTTCDKYRHPYPRTSRGRCEIDSGQLNEGWLSRILEL